MVVLGDQAQGLAHAKKEIALPLKLHVQLPKIYIKLIDTNESVPDRNLNKRW